MSTPEEIAKKLIEIIPPSMNKIRLEMRSGLKDELTVPQFRVLANIYRGNKVASFIARDLGVSQPAISKMIDALIVRGLVERLTDQNDRRHFKLSMTKAGHAFFNKSRTNARTHLSEKIKMMDKKDKLDLERGLSALEKLWSVKIEE